MSYLRDSYSSYIRQWLKDMLYWSRLKPAFRTLSERSTHNVTETVKKKRKMIWSKKKNKHTYLNKWSNVM